MHRKNKWWLKESVEEAAPRKSPRAGLSHLAWKSRKSGGIPTSSTASAATVSVNKDDERDCDPHAAHVISYTAASSSSNDCGAGGLIQTAAGLGGCFGRAWVKRSGLRA
jgi:hypothetical protein